MMKPRRAPSSERVELLRWTARMGAVTAEAVAERQRASTASARSQLVAAEREGLLSRQRPLVGQRALYAITRGGIELSGLRGLGACRVTSSNAPHLIVCGEVAVALEHGYPDHRVLGERELRLAENEHGAPLASVPVPGGSRGGPLLHRPDLILWPVAGEGLPVAVEVELTVKAPRRLAGICRAWARSRHVAGVLYLAPPAVERALERAVERVQGAERIVVAPLDSLASGGAVASSLERTITGDP